MKGKIHLPIEFTLFDDQDDIFLWDVNGNLKERVKNAIYLKPFFSYLYIGEGLYSMVWWNDTLGYWCGEVYVSSDYVETYICETLEELRAEVLADYGGEE